MSKITNLNNYTLLEQSIIDKIYFYPESAISNTKIKRKNDNLCVLFAIEKEKYTPLFKMNTTLINDGKIIYECYSLYLKRLEPYKYVVLNNKNDYLHAEILPKEIIDFNTLEYDSFIKILKENQELSKMIPELTNALKSNMNNLEIEKKVATKIDIPSPTHYYQNITGYQVDFLEKQITPEEELNLSKKILKNIKTNFEVVLYEKSQMTTAYLALYAILLNKVKSSKLKPKEILDSKELKLDTNKINLSYQDLNTILSSIINQLKDENLDTFERNIIQERIEYIITSKPHLKEFKNYLKVILADDKYINFNKRNRTIYENQLKELLINSLVNQNYRPLPRNQILIYNMIDQNNIDFICLISIDKLYDLLKTYKCNSSIENKKTFTLLNSLSSLINDTKIKNNQHLIEISIYLIIMMNIYYYHNVNSNNLLFNKGDYILKLDYIRGNFDIKVINRNTNTKYGHFIKLTPATKEIIKTSLDKSEKTFINTMNKIAYNSLSKCLQDLAIDIIYKEISNTNIQVKFRRALNQDIFDFSCNLFVLLDILTNTKTIKPKVKEIEEEPIIEDKKDTKYGLPKEEYEYLIRKSNTITNIMQTNPIPNKDYQEISNLYQEFTTAKEDNKELIIKEIKKILEKDNK